MEHVRSVLAAFMTLVALCCLAWAAAAHGGRWSMRLDALTHFAPLVLGAAILPAAYAFLVRGWPRIAMLVMAGTAILLCAGLILPEYLRPKSAPAPAAAPGRIKVIQLNFWDRNRTPAKAIAWLKAQDPDIIVLQEVCRVRKMLPVELADYHVTTFDCRVMILSKAEPIRRMVTPLDADKYLRPPVAAATFRDQHGEYTVAGTHYGWPVPAGRQQAQGRLIAGFLGRFPKERLIFTGDLNSTPWSFARRREDAMFAIERRTRALFSWPVGRFTGGRLEAPFPFLPIDQVYAGPGWRTVSVTRGPAVGSDHYPIVTILAP
ncbi:MULTISPECIES: endonuclease/exonuclease/phosphatase family protein [Phenylobacterium]|uniref:Endonuclease/exonuclease/phosphatase (EEP) superfamily protein YafD n=1 Tax=Phenylobacterium koreense TaxID=266125 RepID=A0ABV2EJL4_9CAUL